VGKFAPARDDGTCHSCPAGYSQPDAVNLKFNCDECPAGRWSDKEAASACPNGCPAGTYSSESGLDNPKKCKGMCEAGKFSDQTGRTSADNCKNCAIGTYSANQGQSICTKCPAGRANPALPNDFQKHDKLANCVICGLEEYQEESGSGECKTCPGKDKSTGDDGTDPMKHDEPWDCPEISAPGSGGDDDNSATVHDKGGGSVALWVGLGLSALLLGAVAIFFVRRKHMLTESRRRFSNLELGDGLLGRNKVNVSDSAYVSLEDGVAVHGEEKEYRGTVGLLMSQQRKKKKNAKRKKLNFCDPNAYQVPERPPPSSEWYIDETEISAEIGGEAIITRETQKGRLLDTTGNSKYVGVKHIAGVGIQVGMFGAADANPGFEAEIRKLRALSYPKMENGVPGAKYHPHLIKVDGILSVSLPTTNNAEGGGQARKSIVTEWAPRGSVEDLLVKVAEVVEAVAVGGSSSSSSSSNSKKDSKEIDTNYPTANNVAANGAAAATKTNNDDAPMTTDSIIPGMMSAKQLKSYEVFIADGVKVSYDGFLAVRWAWQMSAAIYYLHKKGILVRNLKASNVYLNAKMETLLGGFTPNIPIELRTGVARSPARMDGDGLTPAQMETLKHSAPELLAAKKKRVSRPSGSTDCTAASDMWSYGIFLIRMLTLKDPYYHGTTAAENTIKPTAAELVEGIAKQTLRPRIPVAGELPHDDLIEIIEGCLRADPKARLKAKDLVICLNNIVVEMTRVRSGAHKAFATNGGVAKGQNMF
jgi:serine/threonine protein kinase